VAVAGMAAVAAERGRLMERALESEGLRRSDELKTALLRGVSHEFRTPLTAIRTAAHALAEDPGAPGAEALLTAMTQETARLDRLVANLLDLSRVEAGALTTRLDWCAPSEVLVGAVEAAEPLLEGREVEVVAPAELPLVRADPVLCERILVNLLHNAARHGAPPIRLEGRERGERLELVVSDAGPGVDPALAARVFDPFVAGPRTGGTGVGLAIARGLAEAQGGELTMAREGGLTRMALSLPLEPVPQVTE
jgi:two-component system sensor histidine kinase KdpD